MDWALSVGVRYYPDKDLGDLDGPEHDASDFYDWVTTHGGVEVQQAKKILSSDFGPPFDSASVAKPTKEACEEFFTKVHEYAKKNGSRAGNRLYLYFSGHGMMPASRENEVGIFMANAGLQEPGHHVLGTAWANMFYKSGYFREVLLFMDCCRHDLKNSPLNDPFISVGNDPKAVDPGRRFFAFATPPGRTAREREIKKGDSRGIFTAALLEGLRGAAATPDINEVRTNGLIAFLKENMASFLAPEDLENPNIPRKPDFFPTDAAREDFVIIKAAPKEFPVEVAFPPELAGQRFLIRGQDLKRVKDEIVLASPWKVTLPIGLYLAEGPEYREAKFQLKHPGFDTGNGVMHVQI